MDELLNGKLTYKEFMEKKDYLITVDITSHYPASMVSVDFIKKPFRYPTGPSRWSIKPETEFNAGKLGFYEIKFTAPENIRFPVLPRKEKINLVFERRSWNLL